MCFQLPPFLSKVEEVGLRGDVASVWEELGHLPEGGHSCAKQAKKGRRRRLGEGVGRKSDLTLGSIVKVGSLRDQPAHGRKDPLRSALCSAAPIRWHVCTGP